MQFLPPVEEPKAQTGSRNRVYNVQDVLNAAEVMFANGGVRSEQTYPDSGRARNHALKMRDLIAALDWNYKGRKLEPQDIKTSTPKVNGHYVWQLRFTR